MQISDMAIKVIRSNNKLIGRLMGHFDRGQATIDNMLDSKDSRLTEPETVVIIKEETGLFDSQILEDLDAAVPVDNQSQN